MKTDKMTVVLLMGVLLSVSASARAEEFQGAPVMPGGDTVKSSQTLLEKIYPVTQEQVLEFYKASLKEENDIKFHVVRGQIYIEEYGNRPWQRVIISKKDNGQAMVFISKDSWTWIIGTLTIRFTGVFVVLLVLYLSMNVATGIISRTIGRPTNART
jgi:hypothetical protein